MTPLRSLAALSTALVLSAASSGCYVHGRAAPYGYGRVVVGVHAGHAVSYARAPYGYAPRPYYGYAPRRAPTVVVAAPASAAPIPAAAPVPATPAGASVDYKDCGRGGPASVHVTFDSNGRATDVRVVAAVGAIDEATARCVRDRFAAITIPSFAGPAQTFSWPVDLGGATPVPGLPGAVVPTAPPAAPPAAGDDAPAGDDGHPGAGGWM